MTISFRRSIGKIPFAQVVWDLQHRLAPFFPSFADQGRWQERERFYAHTLPRAAYAVTGVQRSAVNLSRFYGVAEERIRVLPFPTPADALAFAELNANQTDKLAGLALPDQPFLLYPVMFWPHKNHVGLLHVLRLLRDQHGLDLPLVLTGSGGMRVTFPGAGIARPGRWVDPARGYWM